MNPRRRAADSGDLDAGALGSVDTWGALIDSQGNCAGTDVPQKWHPLPGFSDAEYDQYAAWACQSCPVIAACGMYAIATGQAHGIWGGTAQHRLREVVIERAQAAQSDLAKAVGLQPSARLWAVR